MINPNELRIGNLVLHYGKSKHVSGTNYLGLIRLEQILDVSENAIDPIPLTPEWLEWCGFSMRKGNTGQVVYQFPVGRLAIYRLKYEDWIIGVFDYNGGYINLCSTKMVHQLQNLYFALIGEELIIKS